MHLQITNKPIEYYHHQTLITCFCKQVYSENNYLKSIDILFFTLLLYFSLFSIIDFPLNSVSFICIVTKMVTYTPSPSGIMGSTGVSKCLLVLKYRPVAYSEYWQQRWVTKNNWYKVISAWHWKAWLP